MALWAWVVSLLAATAGCDPNLWQMETQKKPVARPKGTTGNLASFSPAQQSVALQGTIGATIYVQGVRLMRVRGLSAMPQGF